MPSLAGLLEKLKRHYGPRKPVWPTDPYQFLIWNYSGYPASHAKCAKGWESLNKNIGIEPERILAATSTALAQALTWGGMIPDKRAIRIKDIAGRTLEEFAGDLGGSLQRMPLSKARRAEEVSGNCESRSRPHSAVRRHLSNRRCAVEL
jgi:hypothetical protein